MEVGAQQRAAGCCTVSAHIADRPRRTCCFVCVATVVFLLLLGVFLLHRRGSLKMEPFVSGDNRVEPLVTEDNSTVTLLMWKFPFGQRRGFPGCFALYQIPGCKFTTDRGVYPHADGVIIHHRDVQYSADLPTKPRPRAQKWIWMNSESPTHTPISSRFEGVFNFTMSYRLDSDITVPYGYLIPSSQTSLAPRSNMIRPSLVAWVISNWSNKHARVAYYKQLIQYIQVDVFGRAGRPLPEDRGRGSVVRLVERYQFYLAFENSQHTDYITEKLWNAVQAGAVPVVLGPSRKNYERFLPPEAFIHVNDFPTVRGLARYLLMLWRDPALLRKHLDWRKGYGVHQPGFWAEHVCRACREVRRTKGRTHVVKDLKRWFYS